MSARFAIRGWTLDGEEISFSYRCDRYGDFTERFAFPGQAARLTALSEGQKRLLDIAAAAIGVSYYKANACGALVSEIGFPTREARDLIEAMYTEGLGEFYVRNNLPYPPALTIAGDVRGEGRAANAASKTATRAVVAFGGGKDSHVALSLVERGGVAADLISIALSENIERVIADCTDRPIYFIRRTLDPALIAANKAGALNGHIPVTALVSLITTFYASLVGADWVVFANESSADEATIQVDGHAVNHQFSKTLRAESLLRAAISSVLPGGPDYFSVLRPFSELWIARELSRLPAALERFRSCNRNFVFSDADRALGTVRWCGRCAKCTFAALITAPFMTRAQSKTLLGHDVLNDPENRVFAEELAGFSEAKPWECVGTIDEVCAAISVLLDRNDWREAALVREIGERARARDGQARLAARFEADLAMRGKNFLPPQLRALVA